LPVSANLFALKNGRAMPLARVYRPNAYSILAVVILSVAGCRIPGYGGPKSRSVLTSRQLSQQGASALYRQDWTNAESLFARAVAACPADVDSRRHYAETLWHRGAQQEAIAQLAEATKIAPEDPRLLDRLAEFRLLAGQVDQARRDAEAAIDLDPRSADAWMVRGRIMRQLGDNRQALADLHRALSYDPRNAQVLHELAQTYLAAGEPQRALANLQSLLDLHPPGDEPPQLLFETGLAYAGMGRYDDAVESYHLALEHDRANPEILFHLGAAEMSRGNSTDARIVLEQAIARDPANPRYHELLARLPRPGQVR
jgi:tetratricopeptide (TPR) repeat protein